MKHISERAATAIELTTSNTDDREHARRIHQIQVTKQTENNPHELPQNTANPFSIGLPRIHSDKNTLWPSHLS
ncbi:hypothetical protein AAHH80_36490, partial [Burkholderia pseudomallei]